MRLAASNRRAVGLHEMVRGAEGRNALPPPPRRVIDRRYGLLPREGFNALIEPSPRGCNGGAQRVPLPRWCCTTTHILRSASCQPKGQIADGDQSSRPLEDIRQLVDAARSDPFDVLSYVLFTNPPKTRHDRATNLLGKGFGSSDTEMTTLLVGILKAYEARGESELATKKLGQFLTARYCSVGESKGKLRELAVVREALKRMQVALYAE